MAATNEGGVDKPFSMGREVGVPDRRTFIRPPPMRAVMSAPPVPAEAQPFLQYLPTLADWIRKDRRPTRMELSLLRMFAPTAFRTIQSMTYDQIVTTASPFEADPTLGAYVKLLKSAQGRAWMTAVLADVQSM